MSKLDFAIERLRISRDYTKGLLENIDDADWFRQPAEGVTHIAWQVGHIAIAEYSLCLKRARGLRPEDSELVPESYGSLFGRGSQPSSAASDYPSPQELRTVLDRIHAQVLQELAATTESALEEPTLPPHPMFATKLDAIAFNSHHEMLHTGQIALLRRLLGKTPLR